MHCVTDTYLNETIYASDAIWRKPFKYQNTVHDHSKHTSEFRTVLEKITVSQLASYFGFKPWHNSLFWFLCHNKKRNIINVHTVLLTGSCASCHRLKTKIAKKHKNKNNKQRYIKLRWSHSVSSKLLEKINLMNSLRR